MLQSNFVTVSGDTLNNHLSKGDKRNQLESSVPVPGCPGTSFSFTTLTSYYFPISFFNQRVDMFVRINSFDIKIFKTIELHYHYSKIYTNLVARTSKKAKKLH